MNKIFFDTWESLARTVIITIMAYAGLIFLLRVFGKRTLSKMNAFDFIVTIALGSTLATVMLNKDVALIDGLLAFFLLILLQFAITYLSVRSVTVKKLINSTPALLVYKGEMLENTMKKERIGKHEILAVLRARGFSSMKDVDAVVLETNGTLAVIQKVQHLHADTLEPVSKQEVTE